MKHIRMIETARNTTNELQQLYDRQYERLCRAAYRIIKDEEEAREIVQQALIKLWNERDSWSQIKSLDAYLYTSVYHRSINAYKKFKRIQEFSTDYTSITHGYVPPDNIEIDQLEAIINEAVTKLPAKCKEIFLLSREEGLQYKEIANTLNLSIKTVETQVSIALSRIKDYLEKNDPDSLKIFLLFF